MMRRCDKNHAVSGDRETKGAEMNIQSQIAAVTELYSDMHKDAYGYRACAPAFESVEQAQAHMDRLQARIEESIAEEKAAEERAWCAVIAEIKAIKAVMRCGPSRAIVTWFHANGFQEPQGDEHYTPCAGHYAQNAEAVLWNRGVPFAKWPSLVRRMMPA